MTDIRTLRYSSSDTILRPLPGGTSLAFDSGGQSCIKVEVDAPGADAAAGSVQALIHLTSESPGDPDSDPGYTALTLDAGSRYSGPVPRPAAGYTCIALPQWVNNLAVTVYVKRNNAWDTPSRTEFKHVCEEMMVDVPGTACPWFAFADEELVGPTGEPVGQHLPPRVRIPDGAAGVEIRAAGSWRHAPNPAGTSGPEGKGDAPRPMTVDWYSHPAYRSDKIDFPKGNDAPARNTLMALLQPADGTTETDMFPVGAGPVTLTAAELAGSRGIFFGLWDGSQWNAGISNGGNVTVTLKWSV